MTRQERLVKAIAPSGNLFLLITLPELRRQGLTYLAFYALQRAVEIANDGSGGWFSERWLRSETGLPDYETSRACRLLEQSGLVRFSRSARDRRVRLFSPTTRGRRILGRIMSTAADRLWEEIPFPGRRRRVTEVTQMLNRAYEILHGPFQLSIFDREVYEEKPRRGRLAKRRSVPAAGTSSKNSESEEALGKSGKRLSVYKQLFG
jgi:DNA-binding MarR family transcriptional regulator